MMQLLKNIRNRTEAYLIEISSKLDVSDIAWVMRNRAVEGMSEGDVGNWRRKGGVD